VEAGEAEMGETEELGEAEMEELGELGEAEGGRQEAVNALAELREAGHQQAVEAVNALAELREAGHQQAVERGATSARFTLGSTPRNPAGLRVKPGV
jgi:hypothetical protein